MVVLVDMDGILVDLVTPWLAAAHACCPPGDHALSLDELLVTYEAIGGAPCGSHMKSHLTGELFRSLAPMPGAVEGLHELAAAGYDVLIATASAENPSTAGAKLAWIEQHVGWGRHRVAVIQRKELLRGDVFVDDAPANLIAYGKAWPRALRMTIAYPYNRDVPGVRVWESWRDPATAWAAIVAAVRLWGPP